MNNVAMSKQKGGYDFEHTIANGVYDFTGGALSPIRAGYSGNQKIPLPDVVIDDGDKIHAFELKKTSKDRLSVTYDTESRGEPNPSDDLSELFTFAEQYPRTVCPYVGVRFSHRQLTLAKFWMQAPDDRSLLRSGVQTCPTSVKLTRADNLSFHKPETDEWVTATAGDDIQYLLETIDYF